MHYSMINNGMKYYTTPQEPVKQGPCPTKKIRKQDGTESMLTSPFQMEDLLKGINALKSNKAPGLEVVRTL